MRSGSAILWIAITTLAIVAALAGYRFSQAAFRNRIRRSVRRAIRQFELRVERFKLVNRGVIRREIMDDPLVLEAMRRHAAEKGISEMEARVRVESYVEEIVPFFNVLSYYRLGYNLARIFVNLLYRPRMVHLDPEAMDRIPRTDEVVYVANHRSNADYVVVAYLLAHGVSISYAVGEWARVWPLEYVFKSFGSYFIRRRYREPLYHTVLEKYVQLITRNGVTQGIFLEGGLSRDGKMRPAKIGLLDYILRTTERGDFDANIWLVPTAINYDRVLEDRTLIRELEDREFSKSFVRRMIGVLGFLASNVLRLVTLRLRRYGRVSVNFGTPISLEEWLQTRPGVLRLPREKRLAAVQVLADSALEAIGRIIPVTPVPLVAAALLSFRQTMVSLEGVSSRLDAYVEHLRDSAPGTLDPELDASAVLQRATKTLKMRRMTVVEGDRLVILPGQRSVLEYYANSICHLLPEEQEVYQTNPGLAGDERKRILRSPKKPGRT